MGHQEQIDAMDDTGGVVPAENIEAIVEAAKTAKLESEIKRLKAILDDWGICDICGEDKYECCECSDTGRIEYIPKRAMNMEED